MHIHKSKITNHSYPFLRGLIAVHHIHSDVIPFARRPRRPPSIRLIPRQSDSGGSIRRSRDQVAKLIEGVLACVAVAVVAPDHVPVSASAVEERADGDGEHDGDECSDAEPDFLAVGPGGDAGEWVARARARTRTLCGRHARDGVGLVRVPGLGGVGWGRGCGRCGLWVERREQRCWDDLVRRLT